MVTIPEGKANSPKEQVDAIDLNIREYIRCLDSLPDVLFLKKIDDWTPRDITAHLVGWNLITIEGCQKIMKGETPSFFTDPGEDFTKVNAVLVQEHNSTDKAGLIRQMESSSEELKQYVLSIEPAGWITDYGVTYEGGAVTVKNMVDALCYDYINHRKQIEQWLESTAT